MVLTDKRSKGPYELLEPSFIYCFFFFHGVLACLPDYGSPVPLGKSNYPDNHFKKSAIYDVTDRFASITYLMLWQKESGYLS